MQFIIKSSCLFLIVLHALIPNLFAFQSDPPFTIYNVEDGLSSYSIQSLLQDKKGYIWVGTQGGLDRFDGTSFKQFKHDPIDSTSISDSHIVSLLQSQLEDIWVSTFEGGLNRYIHDKNEFERFEVLSDIAIGTEFENLEKLKISAILDYDDDKLLLATNIGLIQYNFILKSGKIIPLNGTKGVKTNTLVLDQRNILWVGDTNGNLHLVYPDKTQESLFVYNPRTLNLGSEIMSTHIDPNGQLYIGTKGNGIFVFDLNNIDTLSVDEENYIQTGLSQDTVTTITTDALGRIWFGNYGEGVTLKTAEGTYNFVNSPSDISSLSNNTVNDILIDKTGNIWVGTWNGLNKLPANLQAFVTPNEFIGPGLQTRTDDIYTILESVTGTLWFGSDEGQLLVTDPHFNVLKDLTSTILANSPGKPIVTDILEDRNNRIWVTTYGGGVYAFDQNFVLLHHLNRNDFVAHSDNSNEFISILSLRNGNLLFGTPEHGLFILDDETLKFNPIPLLPDKDVITRNAWPLLEDNAGNLWVGMFNQGVFKFELHKNEDHWIAKIDSVYQFGKNRAFTLFEDSEQQIWVGTNTGLHKINPQNGISTSFDVENGLSNNEIRGITEDAYKHLWVSTNNGISRYSLVDNTFKSFYSTDGLSGDQFYARAVTKLKSGQPIFGGIEGFTVINPDLLYENKVTPEIVLTDIRVNMESLGKNEHSIQAIKELNLAAFERQLYFSFSMLEYSDSERNLFSYRLEPVEKEWHNFNQDTDVNYSALPYGKYTFHVKGINSNGIPSSEFTLPINIATPFHQDTLIQVSSHIGGVRDHLPHCLSKDTVYDTSDPL